MEGRANRGTSKNRVVQSRASIRERGTSRLKECHVILDIEAGSRPQLKNLKEQIQEWGLERIVLKASLTPG